jgi:hypothetical protein
MLDFMLNMVVRVVEAVGQSPVEMVERVCLVELPVLVVVVCPMEM